MKPQLIAHYPLIEECAGLVLGLPAYNYNITPEMKAFIDRCYPFFEFSQERPGPYRSRLGGAGRKLLCVGVCEQNEESEMALTLPAMSKPFPPLGYEVVAELAITGHFARGSVRRDDEALSKARQAGERLAAALGESES
jgi:multimeric flavodoxin WrbA